MNSLERMLMKWQQEQLISQEQVRSILEYENQESASTKDRFIFILPYLAGFLLALAGLSFVAANWSAIPNGLKLVILIGSLIVSTELGRRQYEKGKSWTGRIGISLGIAFFGASVILIAQMYHLVSFSGTVFYVWSIIAWLYYRFYREILYFLYAAGLLLYASTYEISMGFQMSLFFAILATALIFWAALEYKQKAPTVIFSIIFIVLWVLQFPSMAYNQVSSQLLNEALELIYPYFAVFTLFAVGMLYKGKSLKEFASVATILAFGFWSIQSLTPIYTRHWSKESLMIYLALYIVFTLIVILGLWKKGLFEGQIETMILFLPLHLFSAALESSKVIILGLLIYSVSVLVRGYLRDNAQTFRYGTYAIIISILLIYFQVSFTFLSKSVFFLIAAILVFFMYILLTKVIVLGEGRGRK